MSVWSRIANLFRSDGLNHEIDEELQSHIEEAIAQGRDPAEARRAFGSALRRREESRDIRLIPWLESLRADAVFGWRQLIKRKVTSAAAILSLALAIGSCASAFRLIDATLLRPLPVVAPDRLYVLVHESMGRDGKLATGDACAYPMFRQMRALVKDQAELVAISHANRTDLTFGPDAQMEKANRQYVSGWMFSSFGIRPALGRLLSERDDLTPGAHPYAVLSHDYWTRRFGQDPSVIGRTFRMDDSLYRIVGVAQAPFTGVAPGTVTDIFVPTMMMNHNAIARSDYRWFQTFVALKPGTALLPVREKLRAAFRVFLEDSAKGFAGIPREELDGYLGQKLQINPASAGVSGMQKEFGAPLTVLGILVALVLLIACANVANLMTAQAAARQHEMALRVSIGAGRMRLVQLLLVECAWLTFLAAVAGACFAWWSAPFVAGMIGTPDNPVRLVLPADWRVLGFGLAVALGVTCLFGLAPALHASRVRPASALKGGGPRHARTNSMHALIAVQVAFCFLVLFVAALSLATFDRLSHQPVGFSGERLLALETLTPRPQASALWQQAAEHLRSVRGVEAVTICEWPLMAGESWNGFISVNGESPGPVASYFLSVSPGWLETMKIPLVVGRDFRPSDALPGSAIVSQTFARQYFESENPVGKSFEVVANDGQRTKYQIVGLAADARYKDLREPMQPVAYFPFKANYSRGTFIVRTSTRNPLEMSSVLRMEVARARPGFRVSNIRTQTALVERDTIRERLMAMLAAFFGAVALLLASIGLYGVLDYSVLRRRKEIGIRMAIGAQAAGIAQLVLFDVLPMVAAGALAGLVLGLASVRYIESLFYQVKATDPAMLAIPSVVIVAAALVAALPAVIHAVRIDPVTMLRSE